LTNVRFDIPKFYGTSDPEAYFSWVLKVDKIFRVQRFSDNKKVALASMEFEEYALLWWEQLQDARVANHQQPIDTWVEMKETMYKRFVPSHYTRDLYKKLQELKQGLKSVDEYYKEMEISMMRANVNEYEEQSMARFMNGLNYPIKKIVEFQPYASLVELVHHASKAERHVLEELKYLKTKAFYANKPSSSTPTPSQALPQANTRGPPRVSTSTSQAPQPFKKVPPSSKAPQGSSSGTRLLQCYKCGGQGHKSFECTNKKVMIINDMGEYESMSEDEYNALNKVATMQSAQEEESELMRVGPDFHGFVRRG